MIRSSIKNLLNIISSLVLWLPRLSIDIYIYILLRESLIIVATTSVWISVILNIFFSLKLRIVLRILLIFYTQMETTSKSCFELNYKRKFSKLPAFRSQVLIPALSRFSWVGLNTLRRVVPCLCIRRSRIWDLKC